MWTSSTKKAKRLAKPLFAGGSGSGHELTLAFENGRILELKETKEGGPDGSEEAAQEIEHSSAM